MQSEDIDLVRRTAAAARALLKLKNWTQIQLAKELSVDQPWISNLLRGELKTVSPRVRRAHKYLIKALETAAIPDEVVEAVHGYLSAGGDAVPLAQWVWALAEGQLLAAGLPKT